MPSTLTCVCCLATGEGTGCRRFSVSFSFLLLLWFTWGQHSRSYCRVDDYMPRLVPMDDASPKRCVTRQLPTQGCRPAGRAPSPALLLPPPPSFSSIASMLAAADSVDLSNAMSFVERHFLERQPQSRVRVCGQALAGADLATLSPLAIAVFGPSSPASPPSPSIATPSPRQSQICSST